MKKSDWQGREGVRTNLINIHSMPIGTMVIWRGDDPLAGGPCIEIFRLPENRLKVVKKTHTDTGEVIEDTEGLV